MGEWVTLYISYVLVNVWFLVANCRVHLRTKRCYSNSFHHKYTPLYRISYTFPLTYGSKQELIGIHIPYGFEMNLSTYMNNEFSFQKYHSLLFSLSRSRINVTFFRHSISFIIVRSLIIIFFIYLFIFNEMR